MLTGIGFSGGFVAILINAQCIGFSIYLLLLSVRHPLYKRAKGPIARIAVIVSAVIVGPIIGAMLGAFANGMSPLLSIRKYSLYFSRAVLVGLFFGSSISYVFISLVRCGNFSCFSGFSPACPRFRNIMARHGHLWRRLRANAGPGRSCLNCSMPGIFTGKQSICGT